MTCQSALRGFFFLMTRKCMLLAELCIGMNVPCDLKFGNRSYYMSFQFNHGRVVLMEVWLLLQLEKSAAENIDYATCKGPVCE